jgi:sporulation integral membrane protein YtvI
MLNFMHKGIYMTTDKKRKVIIDIIYVVLIGLSIFFVLNYVIPLILPFVIGFVIAYALKPIIRKLNQVTKIPLKFVSFFTIILFYTLFISLLLWFGVELFNYIKTLFQTLPDLYENTLYPWLKDGLNNLLLLAQQLDPMIYESIVEYNNNILQTFGNIISNVSEFSVSWITNSASKIPSLLVNLLFTVISSFFFTTDYQKIVTFLLNQLKPRHRALLFNAQEFLGSTIKKYIKSYFIIMSITYLELAIGLSILGIDKAIIIAFLIAIFDVLPIMGTGGIMIPWVIINFMEGNTGLGVGLFILYLVVTVIRNVIEPKVVGDQVGLHPIVTLFAMFIGTNLFGVAGLLSFPITLAILKGLHDSGKIVLYKEKSDEELVEKVSS